MTLLMIPLILALSFFFMRLYHPLSLGLSLLLQTILISVTTGMFTYSFWFSYILFMIFLGGMLVLFIYVASLASNEFFNFSYSALLASLLTIILFTLLLMVSDPLVTSSFKSSISLSSYNNFTSTPYIISWIYSNTIMNLTLFMILYLLLTLLVVVKITNLFKGPLRLSN
uniref:NADH dehydrogenase subunit 6 n=1 Tax=Tetralia glaberrima TaxID=652078 RepID=UPI0028D183F4|nr:NADH dehydrogenase subunit 6 [Tetralia glaberrima]YP_010952849.1 NADH dehydrogenase subunit 6 [Tetralia nigrolineata]WMQ53100.1 NADH dehydrogenase subunit 6 [Tetralia glaberrima]WMQ53269.1 NADH dehydrogenase subunit 6 [Tetralia nigrolineata]